MLSRAGCPNCGAPHDPDQAYCGRCGTALSQSAVLTRPPGAPTGSVRAGVEERKLATVLFADVVGFTSLAERTDPETVARMVDAVFREMATVVAEHGGTVDKYMGDCLMAVFGVPVAHEDDAARAVAAALAMSRLGGDLVFSIGINSGEVMATAMGDSGGVTVIGDVVNVAARLEKAAGPGQILCGSLTADLAGSGAVFARRQPIVLKGKKDPVDVWEVTDLSSAIARAQAVQHAPPLIGRHHELAYLRGLLERVRDDGRAQMAVVCGVPGSGKTRLLDELMELTEPETTVVRGAHPAYGATGGERLVADLLKQLGDPRDELVTSRVWSLAGRMDESLKDLDASSLPHEQLWALAQLLEEKTAKQPLLVILDDMHWCGDSLLNLLGNLGARVLHLPLLLVVAGRTEPGEWLQRFTAVSTMRIFPLGRRESAALAAALVGDNLLSDEVSQFLVERSGGNPLYMRELVRMAKDSGSLTEDGGRYRLSPTIRVPASLQAILAARLDALPRAQKEVFEHVALLGDRATPAAIAALGNQTSEPPIGELVATYLLRAKPDGTFEAADPLLREVAYETLPFRIRATLHRRAASVALRRDERARHLERAAFFAPDDGDLARQASASLVEAGLEVAEQGRLGEARRIMTRAVDLGNRDPAVLLTLARLHEGAADLDAASRVLALIEPDTADPSIAIEREHILARLHMFVRPERAQPLLEAVALRWQATGNDVKQAWALANAGVASFNMGRMDDAADRLDQARIIFERSDDEGGAVAVSSFLCLARPTDPRVPSWLIRALEFADRTGDRSKQLTALTPLVWHHFLRTMWGSSEETVEAEDFSLRLAQVADDLGVPTSGLHGRCLLLMAARYSGRLDVAAEHARAVELVLAPQSENWLPAAALFAISVAVGGSDQPVPFTVPNSPDPVSLIATQIVGIELLLSGRPDEALAYLAADRQKGGNLQVDMSGVMTALALVLSGRPAEAVPWVQRAERAAKLLNAVPVQRAAQAIRAEVEGHEGSLPPVRDGSASISDALLVRAHAALGDRSSPALLKRMARSLAAPGLMIGISDPSTDRTHSESERA